MHIINAFVHSQKTFAHSFSLFPPRVFFLKCTCARTPAHTQQHRAVTAFSLQQCHAEMRGPHLVQKTTEISLRTRITTVLLVCLPPPPLLPLSPLSFFLSLSPRDLSLSFLQLPLFYFLSCTTWALQGCRHNLGHSAQPHFNQTRTHIHTRAITHLPLCVLPDTARWERLHYRVELWPCFDCLAREERCVRCVCESVCGREDRDRVKKKERKEASSWNEASLNVCVWTCLHICLCWCVCMCACRSGSGPVSNDTSGHY